VLHFRGASDPTELAEWSTAIYSSGCSSWKPSVRAFGLLRWNGSRVRIEWKGEETAFNPRLSRRRAYLWQTSEPFPKDKTKRSLLPRYFLAPLVQ